MARLIDDFGPRLMRDAWDASQDADAVMSSFTSDTYALAIGEKRDIPVISAPLQPAMITTRDGRVMPNAPLPRRVSRVNEWFGRILIEPFPWRIYGKHVNAFRREIGLAPQSSRQNAAARRRMTVIHGFSRHVVPRPADWPANFHISGYWFLDEGSDWEPSTELADFVASDRPPVCIGFGSMIGRNAEGTTRLLVEAIRKSGERAVLLAGWAKMGSQALPPGVMVLASAPHDWLYRRMAAVVHHGGAGTTAAGLSAGVPNIIIPHMVDQPYWGRRVRALGVGPDPLPRHRLTATALAGAIRKAVSDEAMQRRASILAARIRGEDGLASAVAVVEGIVGT
jgi:UDP:flavonoid glycosyltransferase YjiC (YdhE family)